MRAEHSSSRFNIASGIFNVLDPIPYGFFVGALIFDIIYAKTANVMWVKNAAWLITLGLIFAIIPQLINLVVVWFRKNPVRTRGQVINFWLNVVAIIAALINAFVHSRDAYAIIPDGVWLSIVTVVAMVIGRFILSGEKVIYKEVNHGQA